MQRKPYILLETDRYLLQRELLQQILHAAASKYRQDQINCIKTVFSRFNGAVLIGLRHFCDFLWMLMNRAQSIARLRRLIDNHKLSEARNLCLDLTRTYPQDVELWMMRSRLHLQLDDFDSAAECSQRIIAQLANTTSNIPMLVKAYRTLGTTRFKTGRIVDSASTYERIIALAPNDADAHACLGICRLLLGNFQRGWPEYEWRLKTSYMAEPPCGRPRWNGESLKDKAILVEAEQGHGDTIQFVRYMPCIKALGATTILGCQPALCNLLKGCAGVDRVVSQGDLAPPFDIQITLLSLPGIFQTSLDTIPAEVPYLHVPQGAGVQAVTKIMHHTEALRVGLVWAGGIHTKDIHRSMKLDQFNELFELTNTRFFSLQKGDVVAELGSISQGMVTDLSPYLEDFADTAAAIQTLDLVISVDTAVTHLAGALAKPVWTLIPFAPDWRWMLNREDSPWYPTMRLFRQPKPGDWSSVIARVAEKLKELVQQRSATVSNPTIRV